MRRKQLGLIVATLLVAGCADPPQPTMPPSLGEQSVEPQEVALFLPGMNKELKIL